MPRIKQFTRQPSGCWNVPADWLAALPARHRVEVEAVLAALAALVACDRQAAHVDLRLSLWQSRRVDRRSVRRLVAESDGLRTAAFNALVGLTAAASAAAQPSTEGGRK